MSELHGQPSMDLVGGGQASADVSWVPPVNAVHPINHFHTLYMRLAEINEGLLHEAGRDPEVARNQAFVELLGACSELSNDVARMTRRLEGIRRDFPKVWEAWRPAVKHQPPDGEELKA